MKTHGVERLLRGMSPRAASLVVSVFGDVIDAHGGAIALGTLIRWLEPFGVNERAVRTAIQRLTSDGWFERRSAGRRTDYRVSAENRHRFTEADRRIYAAGPIAWNGEWCVVFLGHGGMSTKVRDRVRRDLRWHGFGELAPSVLVHPSADLEELELVLGELGASRGAVVLRARRDERLPGNGGSLDELAVSAWDLRDLTREYRAYLRRFGAVAGELRALPSPEICFRVRLLALHEYRRILLRDPELPAELLPSDWVGREARRLCARIYWRVASAATAYVVQTGSTSQGSLPDAGEVFFRRFGGPSGAVD
jgi:phenylacetic acid degradation operon negative regulatory protein